MSDPAAPTIDATEVLGNVMRDLQANPTRYRAFGVYWWPIKAMLKTAGYTTENLHYLGDYEDPETAALVPDGDLQTTLSRALTDYAYNVAYPHTGDQVESPTGELVLLWDADAGF
jgi:hypothetical protein